MPDFTLTPLSWQHFYVMPAPSSFSAPLLIIIARSLIVNSLTGGHDVVVPRAPDIEELIYVTSYWIRY